MKLAIFDIDGTLLAASTERRFWLYLLRHGQQGPRQIATYCVFLLRHLRTYGTTVLKKNKAYLTGLEVERVRALAERFVETEVLSRLREPVIARLKEHQRAGDTVVLLSGTLEPIAEALAAALGVPEVRATVCAQRDGRYTATVPEVHPFGSAKVDLCTRLCTALGASLSEASAYGDSHHDLELLEKVGHPVAVQPDPRLLETARERRWEIIANVVEGRAAPDYM